MDSIDYYNIHAGEYYENTVNLDMSEILHKFIALLPEGGTVLDLGCGSGRDSAYLLDHGFDVTSMDASKEMCDLASIHIGHEVLNLSFEQMDFCNVFDGIWASASLLHVPKDQMDHILYNVVRSMKTGGILYMSFKYGDFEGMREDRYYTDYRTKTIKEILARFDQLELIELKKSEDIRKDREDIWINVTVRKIESEYERNFM
ncbi:MAG: Methyltransferase type 11 [Herbinix sp.]|nr:Methyltransferase type 11 [Herbinix sp.]